MFCFKKIAFRNRKKILKSLFIALLVSLFFVVYINIYEKLSNSLDVKSFLLYLLSPNIILGFCVSVCILTFFFLFILENAKTIETLVYKYRYLVAFMLLVFLVFFEISGSSIACWKNYLPNSSSELVGETLWGIPRTIRSDEYAVNTPMALSQCYSYTPFLYFDSVLRGSNTDMFIVYGQPVWDFAVFFRPFHWGYLLFGPSRGLSFFWVSRFLTLFMVTFEFGMYITRRKKSLALALSFLVCLAPVVQWWFAINGFVEMLIYGQLMVLLIYKYLKTNNYKKKIMYILFLAWCAVGYVLTFYPAWMISLGYVFLAIIICTIITNIKKAELSIKDIFLILLFIVLFLGSVFYIFSKSWDTIQSVLNTAYPGARLESGGGYFPRISFAYLTSFFLPLTTQNMPVGLEEWLFFDFYPLGIVLSFITMFKNKKEDVLLVCLLITNIFLTLFCYIQWPEWLSKITLLSMCPPNRVYVAVGFINVLLLVRCLALSRLFQMNATWKKIFIISTIFSVVIVYLCNLSYNEYFSWKMLLLLYFIMFICIFTILSLFIKRVKIIIIPVLCLFIGLIYGGLINPIQQGISVISENTLVEEIGKIRLQNPEALWIVENEGFPNGNIPIMAGARTINSTNVYPDINKWEKIDPHKKYEDIYNRYAHIKVAIKEQNTNAEFELIQNDYFSVIISKDDLKKLNIEYILTKNELSDLSDAQISFEKITNIDDFKIFKVNYKL